MTTFQNDIGVEYVGLSAELAAKTIEVLLGKVGTLEQELEEANRTTHLSYSSRAEIIRMVKDYNEKLDMKPPPPIPFEEKDDLGLMAELRACLIVAVGVFLTTKRENEELKQAYKEAQETENMVSEGLKRIIRSKGFDPLPHYPNDGPESPSLIGQLAGLLQDLGDDGL